MISVIMPTYNKAEYLDYTLASFTLQTEKNFEIVLVNDGGSDVTQAIVDKYSNILDIRYFYQTNKGRAAARNKAIQESRGEILFFNDDDRIVAPNTIQNINSAMLGNSVLIGWKGSTITLWVKDRIPTSNSMLFALAGYMCKFGRPLTDTFRVFEVADLLTNFEIVHALAGQEGADNFLSVTQKYGDTLEGFYFPWMLGTTANMIVKKSLAESVNGFDEGYKGWGMEDTDFSYRLYKNNVSFQFCPIIKNYHQSHPYTAGSISRQIIDRDRELITNHQYFCNKHNALDTALVFKGFRDKKSLLAINDFYAKIMSIPDESIKDELTQLYLHYVKSWRI